MSDLVPCSLCKRPVNMDTADIFEEQIAFNVVTPRTFHYHDSCTLFLDQSGQNCSKCSICGEESIGSNFGDLNLCFDDGCIHRSNKENLPKHYHHCKYHQFNKAKFLGDF